MGRSQGGQAALFAAHYASQWAPELDLRGVAALAPASHVERELLKGSQYLDVSAEFAFTPLMLTGTMVGSTAGATAISPQPGHQPERPPAGVPCVSCS